MSLEKSSANEDISESESSSELEQRPHLKPWISVPFTTAEVTAGESNNLLGSDWTLS